MFFCNEPDIMPSPAPIYLQNTPSLTSCPSDTNNKPQTKRSHLTYQANDPFSRSPLALDEVVPDEALAARIREWQLRGQAPSG